MKLTRKATSFSPSLQRIQEHWNELCVRIGERRAGSPGEQAAADYILEQFRRAGLDAAHAEPFPCTTMGKATADIKFLSGGSWQSVPARVLVGAPGTPGEVEGDLVWVEMPEQASRLFQPSLRGKIVVLVGPLPTRSDLHQRLVKCRPAAVIHVDDRLPFEWLKDDGVYPGWTKRYGMPPTVTIPYRRAWELRKQGALRARARIETNLRDGISQNVVAEIPGRRPQLPLVLLGAHHDTQCNNTGADDNASGVVALLELARLLGPTRPLRTIRLVSFGAEEQLSVGSGWYAGHHRREMSSIGAVFNVDSVASPLGHHQVVRAGTKSFGTWLSKGLAQRGFDAVEKPDPMPFADHFPFSIFGIPAVTFMRSSMDSGMRWQHHSSHDNLDNVSIDELARVIQVVACLTSALAKSERWPFGRGLAREQRAETARLGKELFGLRK